MISEPETAPKLATELILVSSSYPKLKLKLKLIPELELELALEFKLGSGSEPERIEELDYRHLVYIDPLKLKRSFLRSILWRASANLGLIKP